MTNDKGQTSDSAAENPTAEKLSFGTKLAFGAGDLGPAMTANIIVFYLLFFLTDVAGLSPGLAGSILTLSNIWDAINDPIVGVLSDKTRSGWGRRYPWMIFGAIPFGIFFFLQWIVPPLSEWGLFWYYIAISLLFNTAYTTVNLPYTALTPELTEDYDERTNLNSFRFAFSLGGSIISLLIGKIIFDLVEDSQLRYILLGGICAMIAVLPIYWCILGTRDRLQQMQRQKPEVEEPVSLPLLEQFRIVVNNRPFLFAIGIYVCSWLALQVTASIIPYFVVSWMNLPEAAFPQVALAVQGTALVMLFFWSKLSDRLGKKAVYFMGMSLWLIAQVGLFFVQPGQNLFMYCLAVMAGFGVATAYLIPWSMVPDVIDLDELQTGQRREGIFYAFMVLLQKIGRGLGLFLVGQALEFAGYLERVPGEAIPQQPESAQLAIRIAIAPMPALVIICGLILAYFYPITRDVHQSILLQLRERKQSNERA